MHTKTFILEQNNKIRITFNYELFLNGRLLKINLQLVSLMLIIIYILYIYDL